MKAREGLRKETRDRLKNGSKRRKTDKAVEKKRMDGEGKGQGRRKKKKEAGERRKARGSKEEQREKREKGK